MWRETTALAEDIHSIAAKQRVPLPVSQQGAMLSASFTGEKVTGFSSACTSDAGLFAQIYQSRLK